MKKEFIVKSLGILAAIFILNGCENFLEGSDLKNNIDDAVEVANTPDVTLKITANNAQGTLTGETGGTYKLGSWGKLSFEENDDWQFVMWKVLDTSNNEVSCTEKDVIFIADSASISSTFKVNKNISGYTIHAYCEQRPSVSISSPQFQTNGVNRDRAIIVTFNSNIEKSNFRYTSEEEAENLKNIRGGYYSMIQMAFPTVIQKTA